MARALVAVKARELDGWEVGQAVAWESTTGMLRRGTIRSFFLLSGEAFAAVWREGFGLASVQLSRLFIEVGEEEGHGR